MDRDKLRAWAEHIRLQDTLTKAMCFEEEGVAILALLDALEAAEGERDALREDAERLDFVMDQQLLLAHTQDLEYWGVVQVYEDDGDLCTKTVARLIHDTKRQAIDAARKPA